jgi:DNA-binding transcriptional ArsR family regulator
MERRPATADEAAALANPLRLQILRLCLDRALTNQELAVRLGKDPGTILHHVRKLVDTGFLAAEDERRGARGAVERPYRATRKSWTLDVSDSAAGHMAPLDAFRNEWAASGSKDVVTMSRLGVRLTRPQLMAYLERLDAIVHELADADDPAGEPYGLFLGVHRRREEPPERS